MARYAQGKYALAISDISGQAFPWNEMVTQWNGLFVHYSEFESKQPQIQPTRFTGDPQGLANARPQTFSAQSGDGGFMNVDLTLPGDFAFGSNNGMIPDNGSSVNNRRQALVSLGSVTVTT